MKQTESGKALIKLENAIQIASKELSNQKIVSILDKAINSLEVAVRTKLYNISISKEIEHAEVNVNSLVAFFKNTYSLYFGKIEAFDYWINGVTKVAAILSRDAEACERLNVFPEKGVLLFGGVGVGKTSIMKTFSIIFKELNNPKYPQFKTVNTNEIANDFRENGVIALNKYSSKVNEGLIKKGGWFFDDIGNESNAKNFGNDSNVIEEIIQVLYNRKAMKGMVHASTNLTAPELQEKYGERVFSRIKEMFNVIVFPHDAKDMRS